MIQPESQEDKNERLRANALSAFKDVDWVVQKEAQEFRARQIKLKYDSAIKAGFSDAIALYLCVLEWK